MGNIIFRAPVVTRRNGKAPQLTLELDNGSPVTFIKASHAKKLGMLSELGEPVIFHGLGGGSFEAREGVHLMIRLSNVWCYQYAYVVEDDILGNDLLIGHDFLQHYDIKLDPKRRKPMVNRRALIWAQKVKKI